MRITRKSFNKLSQQAQQQILSKFPGFAKGKRDREPKDKKKKTYSVELPVLNERLELWFPGLILPTLNNALSGKVENGEKISHIKVKARAKQTIKRVVSNSHFECISGSIHAFRMIRVDITTIQVWGQSDAHLYDSGNIFNKSLIDALCLPSGRKNTAHYLGIIEDDNPKFVRRVTQESQRGLRSGVRVLLAPVLEDYAEYLLSLDRDWLDEQFEGES